MATLRSLLRISAIAALAGLEVSGAADDEALKLWYRQPAGAWTQALPWATGGWPRWFLATSGANICSSNEDTVWSGEKRDRSNPEAAKAFPEVRRLLLEGHPAQAQALADRTMVSIPRALPVYETLGDLWLDFGAGAEPESYRRELDLDSGIASVRYTVGGVHYVRDVFASAPGSKCIVLRLTADKPGSISFRVTMTRPADATTESTPDGRLILTGQALPKRAPGENNTGVRFRAEVTVGATGGSVVSAADHVDVAGADSATLTIVAATDFREKDLAAACARDRAAASRPYEALRSEHVADHQHFFRRVRFELPADAAARALPRKMERQPHSGMGQQVHHQHQHRDGLLACRNLQPFGTD